MTDVYLDMILLIIWVGIEFNWIIFNMMYFYLFNYDLFSFILLNKI